MAEEINQRNTVQNSGKPGGKLDI